MDNKITRTRFSDFFAYEWVRIIIFCLVAIFVWELTFTITGVKLTTGQQFKIIYDLTVDSETEDEIVPLSYMNGAFSYDVMKIDREFLSETNVNMLSVRYETRDCDVIVTSNHYKTSAENLVRREALVIIDALFMWSYEEMLVDGENYLLSLLNDECAGDRTKVYDYDNLDGAKIDALFSRRQAKDNRFRDQDQKLIGMQNERSRIQLLCKNLTMAKYLLENHADIFLQYTRHEQTVTNNPTENNLKVLQDTKDKNLQKYGKEKLAYGIDLGKLKITGSTQGKYSASSFFAREGKADEVILMAFNFIEYQPHLQFESLSFMNSVVHLCSNLLDGFYA